MEKKPVIAIVDDDDSVREGLVDLVIAMGLRAEAFRCAEDFVRSLDVNQADCLITDVRMPGMNGLDLLDHLLASGRSIPTILITAFSQEADRRRALGSGAICYLSKPFKRSALFACIRVALSSDKQEKSS